MSDVETAAGIARMILALERLPRTRALTFRGLPDGEPAPSGLFVTSLLNATSRDPRVASENFAHPRLLAIAARSGRDISMFGADPAEAELVLLPGAMLLAIADVRVEEADLTVVLVEEVDLTVVLGEKGGLDGSSPAEPAGQLPTLESFAAEVTAVVLSAYRRPALPLTSPGKFAGAVE